MARSLDAAYTIGMRRLGAGLGRNMGALLPTLALSVSLVFGAAAWSAQRRAQALGENGWAALFGVRQRFEPLDFDPKPLKRAQPAPIVEQAAMIFLPAVQLAGRHDAIAANDPRKAAPSFSADERPTVTVYLAPWSTYCHDAVAEIKEMRRKLEARGVATRVVLGLDGQSQLDSFAAELGGDVVFEPGGQTSNPAGGVPAFVVSDGGKVVAARLGVFSTDGEGAGWALAKLGR